MVYRKYTFIVLGISSFSPVRYFVIIIRNSHCIYEVVESCNHWKLHAQWEESDYTYSATSHISSEATIACTYSCYVKSALMNDNWMALSVFKSQWRGSPSFKSSHVFLCKLCFSIPEYRNGWTWCVWNMSTDPEMTLVSPAERRENKEESCPI